LLLAVQLDVGRELPFPPFTQSPPVRREQEITMGIAGSFIGGTPVSLVTSHEITDFNTAGFIGSLVGALVLLLIMGGVTRRHTNA
jgi:hypothetical protein